MKHGDSDDFGFGQGADRAPCEEDAWSLGDRARMDGESLAEARFGDDSTDDVLADAEARRRRADERRARLEELEGRGLEALKEFLGASLRREDRLARPLGAPTGIEEFDGRLLWGGFPKGEMTLLLGELGTGGTSLWIEAAARALSARKWAAWIDGEAPLCPTPLRQKGADLSRLLVARPQPSAPTSARPRPRTLGGKAGGGPGRRKEPSAWLRLAQELLASTLFETVGADAAPALRLRESQARKLLAACRASGCALVLIGRGPPPPYAEMFALIVRFEKKRIFVERALHRPPFELPRRVSHATFSQHSRVRLFLGGGESRARACAPSQEGDGAVAVPDSRPAPRPS